MEERTRPVHQLLRAGLSRALPANLFLTRLPMGCGQVALTFDDGPHPVHTPALLDVLGGLGIHATFFVLGDAARRHPGLVRRICEEGHEVGNHGFTHLAPGSCDGRTWLEDVERGADAIAAAVGQRPRLFRPPFGKVTATQLTALWLSGNAVVLWNVDPRDYLCPDGEALEAWFVGRPLGARDVVLLHDVLPFAARALPGVVARARESELTFGTVSELVKAPARTQPIRG